MICWWFYVVAGLVLVWRLLPGSPDSKERVLKVLKTSETRDMWWDRWKTGWWVQLLWKILVSWFQTTNQYWKIMQTPAKFLQHSQRRARFAHSSDLGGPYTLKPLPPKKDFEHFGHCRTRDNPREVAAMILTGVPRKLNSSQTSSSSSCSSSSSVQPSSVAVNTKWPHVLMSCWSHIISCWWRDGSRARLRNHYIHLYTAITYLLNHHATSVATPFASTWVSHVFSYWFLDVCQLFVRFARNNGVSPRSAGSPSPFHPRNPPRNSQSQGCSSPQTRQPQVTGHYEIQHMDTWYNNIKYTSIYNII